MTRRLKLLLLPLLPWKLPLLPLKLLLLLPLKLPHLLLTLLPLKHLLLLPLKHLLPPLLMLTPPRLTLTLLLAPLLPSKQLHKQAKGFGPERKKPHHGAVFLCLLPGASGVTGCGSDTSLRMSEHKKATWVFPGGLVWSSSETYFRSSVITRMMR